MIARAYTSVKFPILPFVRIKAGQTGYRDQKMEFIPRNPKLFTPKDFDYSPYFNIIKYPIVPVSEYPTYRNLPWQEQLLYSDDVGISDRNEKSRRNDA